MLQKRPNAHNRQKIFYPAAFNSTTIREHPKYKDDLKDLIEER